MALRIVQVDAFANRAFSGNPAAVCVLPAARDEAWMQHVAREMNLAETAFLHPENEDYRLRWFTPVVEVALCGHATLASAHVLWEEGHLPAGHEARFHTQSGLLTARRAGDWIELDFPATPPAPAPPLPGLGARRRGAGPARRRPCGAGRAGRDGVAGRARAMRHVTFPCPSSPADAAARLEAAIDARRWNAPGMDGWIRGGGAVLYYRD